MRRDENRISKAIDELIKIQDDGHGTSRLAYLLDDLNSLRILYEGDEPYSDEPY